jgi:hypothetical protein
MRLGRDTEPLTLTVEEAAKALMLAAMGARHLGQLLETSMPVTNLAAMTKINWPQELPRDG